jgi:hypothetical protein
MPAEPPSVERIEAAARAARKLAEIAEEWADSLLNVYKKAPELAGAYDLINRIEGAYRALRPHSDEAAIERRMVETLTTVSAKRKMGTLKDDQAVAVVRERLLQAFSADPSDNFGIAGSPTDATIRAAVQAWCAAPSSGSKSAKALTTAEKWTALLTLLHECGLALTLTADSLRVRHSRSDT